MNETPQARELLIYAPGAHQLRGGPGHQLERKLRKVAELTGHQVKITSGWRSPHEQWNAYRDYLMGGTLAAPCCTRHYLHPWTNCLRQCASNHCKSRAADCEIRRGDGTWVNIGELHAARVALRRVGCCLPVGSGETWHVEVGTSWLS